MADEIGSGRGYEITVDGAPRTFRDRKEVAIEAAMLLKVKGKSDVVEIRDLRTGAKTMMMPDGRVA
jgi:hypothetical protein